MLRRRAMHAPGPPRRRAFAEDSDRIGAPEPALFLDATVPDCLPVPSKLQITGQLDGQIAIFPHQIVPHICHSRSVDAQSRIWAFNQRTVSHGQSRKFRGSYVQTVTGSVSRTVRSYSDFISA